VLNLVTTWPWG